MQSRRIGASHVSYLGSLGARVGSLSSVAMLCAMTACSSAGSAGNPLLNTSESVGSDAVSPRRVVGYLPFYRGPLKDWTNVIDFSALTHVTLAFASVDTDACGISIHYREKGLTSGDDTGLKDFVKKAHGSSDTRSTHVCLAVGGGEGLSDAFGKVILKDPVDLADKLVKFAQTNELDCIDVDQEEDVSSAELDAAYATFVRRLSVELHKSQMELTAAVAQWNSKKVLPVIGEFDFMSVMAYDYHQPWKTAEPIQASSLEESQDELDFWVRNGADKAKLVWGVPFYGHKWKGGDSTGADALGQAIPYRGIIEQLGSEPTQDELKIGTATITLNSRATVRTKAELARDNYGGVMVWELWQDATGDDQSQLQMIKTLMQSK